MPLVEAPRPLVRLLRVEMQTAKASSLRQPEECGAHASSLLPRSDEELVQSTDVLEEQNEPDDEGTIAVLGDEDAGALRELLLEMSPPPLDGPRVLERWKGGRPRREPDLDGLGARSKQSIRPWK